MSPKPVIVCLGLALRSNGTMDPMLIERCKVAAKINKTRSLLIINTGGDHKNTGITEAKAMTNYMVTELGVKEEDIIKEEKAISTCTNAKYTVEIMETNSIWTGKIGFYLNLCNNYFRENNHGK